MFVFKRCTVLVLAIFAFSLFSLLMFSCKMRSDDIIQEAPKKKNKLEKTQWKKASTGAYDMVVLLDFSTYEDVQEYVTLQTGQEVKSREGRYKLSNTGRVKIKWGKRRTDRVEGFLKGNELIFNSNGYSHNVLKYHKVKDYQ